MLNDLKVSALYMLWHQTLGSGICLKTLYPDRIIPQYEYLHFSQMAPLCIGGNVDK